MQSILHVEELDVAYSGIPVLKNLNIHLHKSEILGIVGESGSGKSTLLKTMMGILGENGQATHGRLMFNDKDLLRSNKEELRRLRTKDIGIVFQHPGMSFNPIRKIGVQFYESIKNADRENFDKEAAKERILAMFTKLNLVDGERILNSYPFELSGGMNQRVGIALAMIMNPSLLLADEPTSALDVTVQAQVVKEFMDLRDSFGTTIILVTHNIGVVAYMADKIAVMYAGQVVEYGDKKKIMKEPKHPYTKSLLAAIPTLDGGELKGIDGMPPTLGHNLKGCAFAPRCKFRQQRCEDNFNPPSQDAFSEHFCKCPFCEEVC